MGMGNPPPLLNPLNWGASGRVWGWGHLWELPPALICQGFHQNAAFAQGCAGVVAMLRSRGVLLRCRGAALRAGVGERARRKGAA